MQFVPSGPQSRRSRNPCTEPDFRIGLKFHQHATELIALGDCPAGWRARNALASERRRVAVQGKARMNARTPVFNGGPKAVTMDFNPGYIGYVKKTLGHCAENVGD
jgi:hypothetical protein